MSERQMLPVFTIQVDQDDPHFFTIAAGEGLRAANRYTLAGVMLRVLSEAQSSGVGGFLSVAYQPSPLDWNYAQPVADGGAG